MDQKRKHNHCHFEVELSKTRGHFLTVDLHKITYTHLYCDDTRMSN
jgi:hypothetical protein